MMQKKMLRRKTIEEKIKSFSDSKSSLPYPPNYKFPKYDEFYTDKIEYEKRDTRFSSWWRYLEVIYGFKGEKIGRNLDIGTGWGTIYYILKEMGFESFGLDLKNMSDISDEDFILFDINKDDNLPFKSESFDTVTLIEVIEHIDNPFSVLKDINRILKKGGFLVNFGENGGKKRP